MYPEIPRTNIYAFNIVCEAKVLTLVKLTKEFHPDWTKERIEFFLKNSIEYAVNKKFT